MRVTHTVDDDAGTVELVIVFPLTADQDRAADVAWTAVNIVLAKHATAAG